ncbi:MAG: hypothetical protein ACOX50_02095 [Patescibacteria group bacterium]|jgi:hypothetical protein
MKKILAQGIDFNQLSEKLAQETKINELFLPGPTTNVAKIISLVLGYVFIFAGLLLFFFLIAGGFQLMTSPNDEKSITSARAKITNALIGFLLLFVSYWIVQIIQTILGFSVL